MFWGTDRMHRAKCFTLVVFDPHGSAARGVVIIVLTSWMMTWRVRELMMCPSTCSLPPFLAARSGKAVTRGRVVGDGDSPSPGPGCAWSLPESRSPQGLQAGVLLPSALGPGPSMWPRWPQQGAGLSTLGKEAGVIPGWPRTTPSTVTAGLAQTPSGGFLATWWPCQPGGSTRASPPWAGCCGRRSGRLRRAAEACSLLLSGSPSASRRYLHECA